MNAGGAGGQRKRVAPFSKAPRALRVSRQPLGLLALLIPRSGRLRISEWAQQLPFSSKSRPSFALAKISNKIRRRLTDCLVVPPCALDESRQRQDGLETARGRHFSRPPFSGCLKFASAGARVKSQFLEQDRFRWNHFA